MNGINALIRRDRREQTSVFSALCHAWTQWEDQPGSGPSPDTGAATALLLDSQPPDCDKPTSIYKLPRLRWFVIVALTDKDKHFSLIWTYFTFHICKRLLELHISPWKGAVGDTSAQTVHHSTTPKSLKQMSVVEVDSVAASRPCLLPWKGKYHMLLALAPSSEGLEKCPLKLTSLGQTDHSAFPLQAH